MITKNIDEGINYLSTQQQLNGSFLCFSSQNQKNFKLDATSHALFPTTQILLCLNRLENTALVEKIKEKCSKFLVSQKNNHWSYNYWIKGTKASQEIPYPDDLDDTFCALSGLYQFNNAIIDGRAMAKIVTLLTHLEQQEGGPYFTWIDPPTEEKVWRDVDLAVNSNIAYFLSLQGIDLPNIVKLIELHIIQGNLNSPYYPTIYPVVYFISRFYKGNKKEELSNLLLIQKDKYGKWGNPLNTALAVSSLINLGISSDKLEKSISYILRTQKNGYWQPYTFYYDITRNNKIYYAGSAAITTAYCLEALTKYVNASVKIILPKEKKQKAKETIIYESIVNKVAQRFLQLDRRTRREALVQLDAVLTGSQVKQIPLLPYYFRLSLAVNGKSVPDEFIINIGRANVFGWIAYTIYDNFLDEEARPKTLPIANIALRELTVIYRELLPNNLEFWNFFQEIMDGIDEANLWEVTQSKINISTDITNLEKLQIPKYQNYEQLAQKSFGHGLGPIAILFKLGYKRDSSEIDNLIQFFKYYLIARQLNDDAHDWEKDLKRGYINPVAAILLKNFAKKNELMSGSQNKNSKKIKTKELITKLQKGFWHKTIIDVCQLVDEHILLAKKSLHAIPNIKDFTLLENILLPLEQATKKAINEQKEILHFLEAYK